MEMVPERATRMGGSPLAPQRERSEQMRRGLLVLGLLAGGLLVFATVAGAGNNVYSKAQLNWSEDISPIDSDLETMPTSLVKLYVQIYDLANPFDQLKAVEGIEFVLEWSPAGPALSGCYELSSYQFPHTTTGDCTYIFRAAGTTVEYDKTDSSLSVASAPGVCNTECDSANIGWVMFDFTGPICTAGGFFQLAEVKLSDCQAVVDELTTENLGDPVTILNGTSVEAATWGRIKQLYSKP
jgi:hypothetical protein